MFLTAHQHVPAKPVRRGLSRSCLAPHQAFCKRLQRCGCAQPSVLRRPKCVPVCATKDSEDKGESAESLFQKELNRRGMTSDTLEDRQGSPSTSQRTSPAPKFAEKDMNEGQLKRSRQLNSEGLEGLIPRLSQLVQLGGSFFLAFLPAVLVISALFSAIYFVYGQDFVHGGDKVRSRPPPYLDPFDLLDAPTVDPMVPLR